MPNSSPSSRSAATRCAGGNRRITHGSTASTTAARRAAGRRRPRRPTPTASPSPASRTSGDKITNTQEADVDEGGIVKKRGDLLVILRRGRLFTVSVAGGGIRPIDHINAFPPGISGRRRLV